MTNEQIADHDAALVAAHPHGIPEGPAAIHFCPVPGCMDIWESEATCEHATLIPASAGCCSACNGTGGVYGGPCADCYGSGCAHPDPCVIPPADGSS